jgi:hypothetical protein
MISITNLKPDDVRRLFKLLQGEGLLGEKEYNNIVKQIRTALVQISRLEKNQPNLYAKTPTQLHTPQERRIIEDL